MGSRIDKRCFANNLPDYREGQDETMPSPQLRTRLQGQCTSLIGQIETHLSRTHGHDEGSVYVDAPGMAYMFIQVALRTRNGDYLVKADRVLDAASHRAASVSRSMPELRPSIMCGPAGVHLLQALSAIASLQLGRRGTSKDAVTAAVSTYLSHTPSALHHTDSDEWLYGRAGFLVGLILIKQRLSSIGINRTVGEVDTAVHQVAERMLVSGRHYASRHRSRSPLMYAWQGDEYLGAAHGVMGILYVLMHVDSLMGGTQGAKTGAKRDIRMALEYLLSLETAHHNWPAVVGETADHLVHFCHGAPGAILMFVKAYQVYGDVRYLRAAERAGECVWRYGLLRKGPGTCHGIAGNGYVLLTLFRCTRHRKWLHRACEFAGFMFTDEARQGSRTPDNPFSLYEGVAGSVCFLQDVTHDVESARFPLFELS
ncbi:unnamed protein product [Vitrella brassicaformis CCMP3155]|uniref:Uncharacterized protein n=1 Tax=Vitrella brassicaformis (strain CCMP3155) TaxID=1169540 RepID=A0A0G4EE26_VITBC|nr:unnamed protein product [Vitrella brassicaformis CCMP3155]|mmetsp:Transcript_38324/g.109494  ORF Transcript_38324/g.109494 Transcript_38324/m.109494 type:complete len:427 (+) Transcript_38324:447-1727(+)|eukprot:CEL93589.1 unnamed protein product [Vitrella brassicaformis CCMP3155]